MPRLSVLIVFLLVCFSWYDTATAAMYEVTTTFYSGVNGPVCTGTPSSLYITENSRCDVGDCVANPSYSNLTANSTRCISDFHADVQDVLCDAEDGYLLVEFYSDSNCSALLFARASKLSSTYHCEKLPQQHNASHVYQTISKNVDGTVTLKYYEYDDKCTTCDPSRTIEAHLNSCSLVNNIEGTATTAYVMLRDQNSTTVPCGSSSTGSSGSSGTGSSGSSLSLGSTTGINTPQVSVKNPGLSTAIVGIIAGAVIIVMLLLVIAIRQRNASSKEDNISPGHNYARRNSFIDKRQGTASESKEGAPHGQIGLWDNDAITAARVSRDKVRVGKLISRGAYGEVYAGVFNNEQVVVKMLPRASRKSIPHVNALLAEVKTAATMEHPRIVTFIGVAWDSLIDLCVVMEFMEGGDLRSLLNKYELSRHPVGFDRQKITIALHVCHGLTYMHSMAPVVIHRDLKSRNILLGSDHLEAKLTDFGISRERLNSTMTAGVGTSLWMAPEVMLGNKYDEKADIFSFGVVLSELDVHTLPYENSKAQSRESSGREMGSAILLQSIATGALRVEFSTGGPNSMAELGLACISVEPKQRPTAAEALYSLQVILREELI